ncbi:MAG: hypothetical protein ACO2ZM_04785 [Francisellaceae bacterium]
MKAWLLSLLFHGGIALVILFFSLFLQKPPQYQSQKNAPLHVHAVIFIPQVPSHFSQKNTKTTPDTTDVIKAPEAKPLISMPATEKQEIVKTPPKTEPMNRSSSPQAAISRTTLSNPHQIQAAFAELENQLFQQLSRHRVHADFTFSIRILLDINGQMKRVTFTPSPPISIRQLINAYLQAQTITQTLRFNREKTLIIPVEISV